VSCKYIYAKFTRIKTSEEILIQIVYRKVTVIAFSIYLKQNWTMLHEGTFPQEKQGI
jgi:hypothetical protein